MAQVVEAVVIGVVILGATTFAVAFQAPPSPETNPGTEQTESATYGALNSLEDLYIDDTRYNHSALSKALADAAAGANESLVDSIGAFLPPEANFCVHLNNGQDRIELYCPRDPPGAAVGVSYPIEPNWRFHYAESDLRYYDSGSDTQLGLSQIPIMNAHTVRDEGDYVNVSVSGEQSWRPGLAIGSASTDFENTAFSTLLQGDDEADYPSASIYMQCQRPGQPASHEPCYASDLTEGMTGYAPYEDGDDGKVIRFTVDNAGPGSVPADASLKIEFPVGLDVNRPIDSPAGFENITVTGEDSSASETVKADLASGLGEATIDLDVEVNVTDTRYAYKQVDAKLSDGAVSSSQLLLRVQNKTADRFTGGDERVVMISSPKPAGSADDGSPTGRWGVVVPIPYAETQLRELNLSLHEGQEVLDGADWPSDFHPPAATGDTRSVRNGTIDDSRASDVTWKVTPDLGYEAYTFAEFQFEVTTDGTQTRASERFPFAHPRADFGSYDPPPQSIQTEPGIWWRSYPPAETDTCASCPGYEDTVPAKWDSDAITYDLDTELDHRGVVLEGESEYQVADLKDVNRKGVRDALQSTDVTTTPARLAPGDHARIHLDTEDLAHYVAETTRVTDMRLDTKIYAPWGIPNRTPVETIDHGRVGGGLEAPNDLLPLYVNGDSVEDVITASTDGNVYAIHGDTGEAIAGAVFGLPDGSGAGPATPSHLSHGTDDVGNDIIGVGTKAGVDQFYTLDGDLDKRWNATKPDNVVETRGIHVGEDLTDDGVPEVILSTKADNVTDQSAYEQSRLTVWEGRDVDGDGTGDVLDGYDWDPPTDYGLVVNGEPTQLGMAKIGVQGKLGIWADTGPRLGTNVEYVANQTEEAIMDGDYTGAATQVQNTTIKQAGSGFYGFSKAGNEVLNLSGIRVVRAETVEDITDGSKHSGIGVGGANGWAWGLNGSATPFPVGGYQTAAIESRPQVAMGNKFDGYMSGRFLGNTESYLQATSSAWTDYRTVWWDGEDMVAVDTPEGSYQSDETAISWWAGTKGGILRSTDRLQTLENKGGIGANLVGQVDPGDPQIPEVSLDGVENLQLSAVNFTGVHAVDEDEAWFVGQGIPGTDLESNGVILHTYDGGNSYQAVELTCGDLSCNLEDIDHDGQRLWVVGDDGTVLVNNVSGMASDTSLNGEARINDTGHVDIPMESERNVSVDNVTVTWDPRTSVSYGEAVTLANSTSDARDLWYKDKGCQGLLSDSFTEEGTCSSTWGYDHGNTLRVKDYVEDSDDGVNRTLDGEGNLTVGRFTDGLVGYRDADWYEQSTNLPLTFHVNVSFSDRTRDSYTVHINNSGGINTTEGSASNWTHPADLPNGESFSTPDCFGQTQEDCPTITSINITNVGTEDDPTYIGAAGASVSQNGTPLYRLGTGTATWTPVSMPVATTLNDVTVNPSDTDRWIAGDDSGRVLLSYDEGETWRPVPSGSATVNDVDYSHPVVANLVGGQGTGERLALNGYVASGRAETVDLYDETNHDGKAFEKITLASPPTVDTDRGGSTPTKIQVWDEHAKGGQGAWGTIYDSEDPGLTYNYTAATQNVTLRFKLTVDDMDKYSPMVRGDLTLGGHTHDNLALAENVSIDLDLTEASKFRDVEEVDYNANHGYLRLKSVRTPWLYQLGNQEEGDWSAVRNGTVGARVADMEVAQNGSTMWVLTEGIYEHDAAIDGVKVQDPECKHGAARSADCHDNTLYAIDVETGELEEWWDPVWFSEVPHELAVGSHSLSVMTGNRTEEPTLHWMEFDDPRKDQNATFGDQEHVSKGLIVADAWASYTQGQDDPIVALQHLAGGDGDLFGHRAPDLTAHWKEMPALNEEFAFDYEVPDDALYGSRVVLTQVRWNVTGDSGTELVQSGRLHDTFDVTPNGQQMPLVPTYTLEVVAWIQDWR